MSPEEWQLLLNTAYRRFYCCVCGAHEFFRWADVFGDFDDVAKAAAERGWSHVTEAEAIERGWTRNDGLAEAARKGGVGAELVAEIGWQCPTCSLAAAARPT